MDSVKDSTDGRNITSVETILLLLPFIHDCGYFSSWRTWGILKYCEKREAKEGDSRVKMAKRGFHPWNLLPLQAFGWWSLNKKTETYLPFLSFSFQSCNSALSSYVHVSDIKKNYVQTCSGRVVQINHAADETLILILKSQLLFFSYTKVVLLDCFIFS